MRQFINKAWLAPGLLLMLLAAGTAFATDHSSANFICEAEIISGGGDRSESANYINYNSIGQSSPLGDSENIDFHNYPGFWSASLCMEDSDLDLLPNCAEYAYGLDPLDPDWDNDGLLDGEEIILGTDPKDSDTDNDGLDDGDEIAHSTNPRNPDCDQDGMPDGWEVANGLLPWVDDAWDDIEPDGRRNLDEYLRGFDPGFLEPCGWNKYGAGCFADGDGNGISDGPDLGALGELLAHVTTNLSLTLPQNGDGLDLDGNGVVDGPDYAIMKQSLSHTLTNLDGQANTIVLESGSTVPMHVGDWTKIEMSLKSTLNKPRSGYGIVFYIDDTSTGAGQLWGGDGEAVPAGTPPAGYPAGSRYCITGEIDAPDNGKAAMWFKATAIGTVIIKAGVPANTQKHTKELGPSAPVTITISNP